MSNVEALKLLGEIDGVEIVSKGKHTIAVNLEIGKRRINIFKEHVDDVGGVISHHITRIGLCDRLERKR